MKKNQPGDDWVNWRWYRSIAILLLAALIALYFFIFVVGVETSTVVIFFVFSFYMKFSTNTRSYIYSVAHCGDDISRKINFNASHFGVLS